MILKRLFSRGKRLSKEGINIIQQARKEASIILDDIEASLDGEDKWFLNHYDSKQEPSCGFSKRPRTQE